MSRHDYLPFGEELFAGTGGRTVAQKLTDTTRMTDPRQEPTFSHFFTVGDAAFFTLIRLVDVPFEKVLPYEVMSRWKDRGLYTYFEYVQKEKNRKKLQASVVSLNFLYSGRVF